MSNTMDNEKCRVLIQLYGSKNLLWNSKSPNYHNKSLREDAWRSIGMEMGFPISELKKKMTTLLASYRREKSRTNKSLITGSGTHEIYVTKWFAFHDFDFMKDKDNPTETFDTLPEQQSSSIQDEINDANHINETDSQEATYVIEKKTEEIKQNYKNPETTVRPNLKRKKAGAEESPMLKKAFAILNETTDSYSSYGQHIANELRKYDDRTLIFVKQAINNIIFEADLGKYQNYGYNLPNFQGQNNNPFRSTPSPQSSFSSPQSTMLPSQTPSPQPLTSPSHHTPTTLEPSILVPFQSPSEDLIHVPLMNL